jgi:hypothetical protein
VNAIASSCQIAESDARSKRRAAGVIARLGGARDGRYFIARRTRVSRQAAGLAWGIDDGNTTLVCGEDLPGRGIVAHVVGVAADGDRRTHLPRYEQSLPWRIEPEMVDAPATLGMGIVAMSLSAG